MDITATQPKKIKASKTHETLVTIACLTALPLLYVVGNALMTILP